MVMYGTENPQIYNPGELFNPTTANMVLLSMGDYANALRQDYIAAREEQKDFLKDVNNFISPFAKDMDSYYNLTAGKLKDLYDQAEANGIDLLRSQQGRAMIQNFIMSRPYADLAKLKQSAKTGEQYLKNMAEMRARGEYNPALEAMSNPVGFEGWSTLENGTWNKMTPTLFKDLNKYTTHIFDNLQDSDLGVSPKDKRYRRTGVTEDQMRPIVDSQMNGLLSTELGQFYYNAAKNELIQLGNATPTDAEIRKRFADNVIIANKERIHVKDEVDPFYMKSYESNLTEGREIRKEQREDKREKDKLGLAHKYKMEEIAAKGGSGSGKGGRNGSSLHYNVYNTSNEANGIGDVTIEQMDNAARNVANHAMEIKFAKYKTKDGKIPESVKNTKAYKNAYNTEYQKSFKNQKIKATKERMAREANVVANSHVKNSSALAIGLGEDEIANLSGVLSYDFDTHQLEGYANKIYTLKEINDVRTGKTIKNGLVTQQNAAKGQSGKITKTIKYGNTNNFIQQTEPSGKIGWYVALDDGTYYKLGAFDPSRIDLEYAGLDQRYLKNLGVNPKTVDNVLPDTEQFTQVGPRSVEDIMREYYESGE